MEIKKEKQAMKATSFWTYEAPFSFFLFLFVCTNFLNSLLLFSFSLHTPLVLTLRLSRLFRRPFWGVLLPLLLPLFIKLLVLCSTLPPCLPPCPSSPPPSIPPYLGLALINPLVESNQLLFASSTLLLLSSTALGFNNSNPCVGVKTREDAIPFVAPDPPPILSTPLPPPLPPIIFASSPFFCFPMLCFCSLAPGSLNLPPCAPSIPTRRKEGGRERGRVGGKVEIKREGGRDGGREGETYDVTYLYPCPWPRRRILLLCWRFRRP